MDSLRKCTYLKNLYSGGGWMRTLWYIDLGVCVCVCGGGGGGESCV